MHKFSAVGKSVRRIDALEKVTGAARFCADFSVPGMCYAKVLRSPYPHARILRIDTSKAEKLPGVRAVVTGKDAPDELHGMFIFDQPLIAREVVRFVGEPVAVVVADSIEIAEDAFELVDVDYEELLTVFDVEEAMKPDCHVVIHPDLNKYIRIPSPLFVHRPSPDRPNVFQYWEGYSGDVEQGFKEADLIVENRYSVPRIQHAPIEPHHVDAWLTADGGVTIRTKRQGIHTAPGLDIARLFGIPPSNVRILSPYVGGAFGGSISSYLECLGALLTLKSRRPVRLALSRAEEFIGTTQRPERVIYIKDGVNRDGTIVARQIWCIIGGGAYSEEMALLVDCAGADAVGVYRIPNFRFQSYGVYTNQSSTGAFRGVGGPELNYALEQQMDILAEKLGIDSVEIRKTNLLKEGERNCMGQVTKSIGADECLERVAKWSGWRRPPEALGEPWRKGRGISIGCHVTCTETPAFVTVKVHMDGMIEVRHGADELGQGLNTVLAQIVAEELVVAVDSIKVIRGDTAVTPFDFWSASSRSTFYTGNATRLACRDIRRQILKLAAPRLGASPKELETRDWQVYIKAAPERSMSISDLFIPLGIVPMIGDIIGKGAFNVHMAPCDPETGHTERWFAYYAYGAHGVEVAVNVDTGEVRVEKIVGCFDMGQPINPKMCEQQIEGGIGMGIGSGIYEELVSERGVVLNPSFMEYKLPTTMEVPSGENIGALIGAVPLKEGPFGAKGFAEAVLVSLGPAIGQAFYNATGVRIRDLPLSREKVLKALKEAGKAQG